MQSKLNNGYPALRFKETKTDAVLKYVCKRPYVNLIEVGVTLSKYVNGKYVLAGYKDGKLISVDAATYDNDTYIYTKGERLKLYYNGGMPDVVKVMVIARDGSLKPLCNKTEIKLSDYDDTPSNYETPELY